MYNNIKEQIKIFREESSVAIEHSFKLSKTVMSALVSKMCEYVVIIN